MTFSRSITFEQLFQSCSVLLSLSVFVTTSPEYLSQPCYIKSKPCIKHRSRCRLFVSNTSCQPVRPLGRSYISNSVYPQRHPWFIDAVPWEISEHVQTTKISDDICHTPSTFSFFLIFFLVFFEIFALQLSINNSQIGDPSRCRLLRRHMFWEPNQYSLDKLGISSIPKSNECISCMTNPS